MLRRSLLSLLVAATFAGLVAPVTAGYVAGGRTIWTIAGNGVSCVPSISTCGDGPSAIDSSLTSPGGIAVAPDGAVYIADTDDHKVRKLTTSGSITTVAGTGAPCPVATSACGDGGAGTTAQLAYPRGLALGSDGGLYIADSGTHRIRRLSATGTLTTVAGSGEQCADAFTACGDGAAPTSAMLNTPSSVAIDPVSGDVYVADTGNNRIRKVTAVLISTAAGTGATCTVTCGDGGPASGAAFNAPGGIALDGARNVYVADTGAHRIRKITASTGSIATIAGDGSACAVPTTPCGDGGPPTTGKLTGPLGVSVSGDVVYVADSGANKIRRISRTISTIAGTGELCSQPPACGDGGAATAATLSGPAAVAIDGVGDLFVADSANNLVRWLSGPGAGSSPPPGGGDPPASAPAPADQQVLAGVQPLTQEVRRSAVTGPLVRCKGSACRILAGRADTATTERLRRLARDAPLGRSWVRVELRRGGRRWATGTGRTLAQALTLLPERKLRAGTYRLRITQVSASGQRRRDRIVRLTAL